MTLAAAVDVHTQDVVLDITKAKLLYLVSCRGDLRVSRGKLPTNLLLMLMTPFVISQGPPLFTKLVRQTRTFLNL